MHRVSDTDSTGRSKIWHSVTPSLSTMFRLRLPIYWFDVHGRNESAIATWRCTVELNIDRHCWGLVVHLTRADKTLILTPSILTQTKLRPRRRVDWNRWPMPFAMDQQFLSPLISGIRQLRNRVKPSPRHWTKTSFTVWQLQLRWFWAILTYEAANIAGGFGLYGRESVLTKLFTKLQWIFFSLLTSSSMSSVHISYGGIYSVVSSSVSHRSEIRKKKLKLYDLTKSFTCNGVALVEQNGR